MTVTSLSGILNCEFDVMCNEFVDSGSVCHPLLNHFKVLEWMIVHYNKEMDN